MRLPCHGSVLDHSQCNNLRFLCLFHACSSFSCRWSYGANRVQMDVDIKLLSEVLSYLQADVIRGYPTISSLHTAAQSKTSRKNRPFYIPTNSSDVLSRIFHCPTIPEFTTTSPGRQRDIQADGMGEPMQRSKACARPFDRTRQDSH